jgi:hypothetical protein
MLDESRFRSEMQNFVAFIISVSKWKRRKGRVKTLLRWSSVVVVVVVVGRWGKIAREIVFLSSV